MDAHDWFAMPVTAVAALVQIRRPVLTLATLIMSSCSRAQHMEESVRIAALRASVQASKAEAVEQFVGELKARGGTPLIEELSGDAQYLHVTFVWQGDSSTRGVLIDWYPFTVSRTAELTMVRVEGTNLWHRTLRVPRGSRFLYQLSVNDPRSRMRDLGCRPEFSEFLAKELAPFLQRKYRASAAPEHSAVGGASRGGLAAICAALHAPRQFGMVISQSGSLWYLPANEPREPLWRA